jgi:copper transport protein
LLLVKIGLVVLLVGIAWISRRWTARLTETAMATQPGKTEDADAEGAKAGDDEREKRAGERRERAGEDETAAPALEGEKAAVEGVEEAGEREHAVEGEREHAAARAGSSAAAAPGEKGASAAVSDKGTAAAGSREAGASADPSGGNGADPERAAQLARQQAAIDSARQKQQRDADPHRFGLRRSVLAEAAVAVVLLAVTTMLTSTEPGRTEEEARAATSSSASDAASSGALTLDMSFDTGGEDGKGVVRVDLDPARVGGNEMHVYVQRPNGRAFDIPEVKIAFTLEAQDIGPLPVVPDHIATGHWAASGVQIPMAGEWKVAVTVRTSDVDQTTVSKNAQIG